MTPASLTAALKDEALRLGFDLAGAAPAEAPPHLEDFQQWLAAGYAGEMRYLADRADAYAHPRHVLPEAKSLLVLAMNYGTVVPAPVEAGQGTVSRYAWGTDYHDTIHERLERLADLHRRLVPDAQVRGVVDTAPLLERQFGKQAGLGWVGKNTMLLNKELGSWFFLGVLLTTAELVYDEPYETSHCGACRACLDACPTGALREPYQLDARRCISYLTIELRGNIPAELRPAMGDRLFGCDACQEVCPWNCRGRTTTEDGFQPRPGLNPVVLAELFALDDAAFRQRFRHTPLWRSKRRGILRNAALVLANRPHDAALPGLIQGLGDCEPIARSACAWALGQYAGEAAREALGKRLAVESDPDVVAEIRAALASAAS
jgi:epoxyqueuosine reductase